MKSGQRSYVPGVGYIAVISVEPVEMARLTDADAVRDGFSTADLLRKEIRTLYAAEKRKKLTPFRVCFSVYPPLEQQRISKERQKQKQERKRKQSRDIQQQEFITQTLDKLLKLSKPEGKRNKC